MFQLDINKLLQSKTFWIVVGIIFIIFVVRNFSHKINEMSKKFDEMREEDLRTLARFSKYQKHHNDESQSQKPSKKTRKINKGEEGSKKIDEQLFNKEFCTIRPDFLKNDCTDVNMEIDGYNDELKLGFEYQGVQHYKYTPYFHKDINDFNKQIYRDNLKRELLEKDGIKIIYVPYSVEHEDMENYVKNELQKMNYSFT